MKTLLRVFRGKDRQEKLTWIALLLGVFICSSVFGFVYETVFYWFNDHMLLHRGSTFLPVIQLYGWGGLLIFLAAYDLRKHAWKVLLTSGLACGLLELGTGYMLYSLWGYRGWDYNTEIWNWGNIGGFVCIRSVSFFAVSGLLLIYGIIPLLQYVIRRIGARRFTVVMGVITAVVLLDILYNDILINYLHLPGAPEIYEKLGWHSKETMGL